MGFGSVGHYDERGSVVNVTGRETFILGAGFSRAISSAMPLTDELGQRLTERSPDLFAELIGGGQSFEQWLSHRAEARPYLSTAENLKRQAVFAWSTEQISRELDAAIYDALGAPMRAWLGQLIALWHLNESNVLTFNYDTLVECAFETLNFWDWRMGTIFQWGSLIDYNPRGMAGASFAEFDGSGAPHPSFRLWKLHGSTNWFWTPADASGASAMRTPLPGRFGDRGEPGDSSAPWRAPGRERLLVPPSALKSPYYANPVSRAAWTRGFEALKNSEIVTLMGYSLPPTDLMTVGMLADAVAHGCIKEIRVVDPSAPEIAQRIEVLAQSAVNVVPFDGGQDPVPAYVATLLREAAATGIDAVRDATATDGAHVTVTWGDLDRARGRTALALGASRAHGATVEVRAADLTTFDGATAGPRGSEPDQSLSVAQLRAVLDGAREIVVRVGTMAEPFTVIAAASKYSPIGRGDGNWLQLVPADPPPTTSSTAS